MRFKYWIAALVLLPCAVALGCHTSSPAMTPQNAALATGIAVAAAAVNRSITHECWAMCRPGTFCDHTTGLCVERAPGATAATPAGSSRPPIAAREVPYPAGHSFEVPPETMSSEPVLCTPDAGDAGATMCDHDSGLVTPSI